MRQSRLESEDKHTRLRKAHSGLSAQTDPGVPGWHVTDCDLKVWLKLQAHALGQISSVHTNMDCSRTFVSLPSCNGPLLITSPIGGAVQTISKLCIKPHTHPIGLELHHTHFFLSPLCSLMLQLRDGLASKELTPAWKSISFISFCLFSQHYHTFRPSPFTTALPCVTFGSTEECKLCSNRQ